MQATNTESFVRYITCKIYNLYLPVLHHFCLYILNALTTESASLLLNWVAHILAFTSFEQITLRIEWQPNENGNVFGVHTVNYNVFGI